mmetsp:Transcript_48844/g.122896  ORF Transcript_48844/g.122896 Transcript_48844/m.122896 type:complete len:223 (+) Transcript_48844:1129-1797(+)
MSLRSPCVCLCALCALGLFTPHHIVCMSVCTLPLRRAHVRCALERCVFGIRQGGQGRASGRRPAEGQGGKPVREAPGGLACICSSGCLSQGARQNEGEHRVVQAGAQAHKRNPVDEGVIAGRDDAQHVQDGAQGGEEAQGTDGQQEAKRKDELNKVIDEDLKLMNRQGQSVHEQRHRVWDGLRFIVGGSAGEVSPAIARVATELAHPSTQHDAEGKPLHELE